MRNVNSRHKPFMGCGKVNKISSYPIINDIEVKYDSLFSNAKTGVLFDVEG